MAPDTDPILAALRHVIDPEVGIDLVDLGLVYQTRQENDHVHIVMTMTAAACPLGESMIEEVKTAIRQYVPGVTSVSVDLVWEPAWDPSMMSATARERLGWK